MMFLGDYAEDYATLNFYFSTHKADGTPIALAGTPAISVYKGSSTTQSTAGITLDVDFDGVTGLNHVLIDLSADAFYAVANDYSVVITTGTVDSISVVGMVVAHFSIENRNIKADLVKWLGTAPLALSSQQVQTIVNDYATGKAPLQPATAGRTLVVDAAGLADANMVKAGPTGAGTAQTAGDIYALLTLIQGLLTPVSQAPASQTVTYGSVIGGSYANCDTDDDNRFVLAPVAVNGLDVTLVYALGANRVPIDVSINGYWSGASRFCDIYAWDYLQSAWNKLTNTSTRLSNRGGDANYLFPLTLQNMDPATGAVQIRFVSTSVTTADRLNLDKATVNNVAGAGAAATLTAQQVWEYATRTLTTTGGDPIDTTALVAAIAAALLINPTFPLLTDAAGKVTPSGAVTVTGDVTLAATQPNYAPAKAADIPTTAQIADKFLGRNLAGGSDGGRTVTDSLRTLRNKVVIDVAANAITVYAEDDVTIAWAGVLTTNPNAVPITAVDPS